MKQGASVKVTETSKKITLIMASVFFILLLICFFISFPIT